MDLPQPVHTAERKRLRFKETLSQLNKERWRRGGADERELHNQLSHKVGQNISAAPTDSTPFFSLFFFVFDMGFNVLKGFCHHGKNIVIIRILIMGHPLFSAKKRSSFSCESQY